MSSIVPRIVAPGEAHTLAGRFHSGISMDAYHADKEALSRSGIVEARRSAAHFLARWRSPAGKDTKALRVGSGAHPALFEPEVFARTYVAEPDFGDSKMQRLALAQWEAQLRPGTIVLPATEYALAMAVAQSAREHPLVGSMLAEPGAAEFSGYWVDAETGILCRMRPDWMIVDRRIIVDLKTTEDASRAAFMRSIEKFGYDIQADHYLTGASAITGIPRDEWHFVFVAVEKSFPFVPAVYVASAQTIARGREQRAIGMQRIHAGITTGSWAGYSGEAEEI